MRAAASRAISRSFGLGPAEFFIITGSAQTTRDFAWIERAIRADEHAALVDVTNAYSVISVMGPKAEALLNRVSPDDLSKTGMPFSTTKMIDVGYARVRAARMSYVGGPGYELYVSTDQCVTLYEALWSVGGELGLRDAGYYTIDALRIEAGRRAWGAELSPDETPWEAGLGYAVKMDKPAHFIGRDALAKQQAAGVRKRLVMFTFDDPAAFPWGGEPILMNGTECRRAHIGRLQPQARTRGRNGLCARGGHAHRRDRARRRISSRHRRRAFRGDAAPQADLARRNCATPPTSAAAPGTSRTAAGGSLSGGTYAGAGWPPGPR